MEAEVEELIGNEESLTTVKLKNGESIAADIVLVGIGKNKNPINHVVELRATSLVANPTCTFRNIDLNLRTIYSY